MKASLKQAKFIANNVPLSIQDEMSLSEFNAMYARCQELESNQAHSIISLIKEADDCSWRGKKEDAAVKRDGALNLMKEYKIV
jgi:hypothetical protein